MSDLVELVERSLGRIKLLIPVGENVKDYLAQMVDRQLSAGSQDSPMGVVPASILSQSRLYASARIAVEYIDQPERLVTRPEGIVDLGVIEWLLRPALPLKSGFIDEVGAGPWQHIAPDVVKEESQSVCRLDISVEGYTGSVHIGTGFVAGRDGQGREIIMTNAHVVEEALVRGWTQSSRLIFGCDFARFETQTNNALLPLAKEYKLHPVCDLAILFREEGGENQSGAQRSILRLTRNAPEPAVGCKIGVLGHPSFDFRLDPFPKFFGFGNEFGIKRFSPGEIRGLEHRDWRQKNVQTFLHDASTLSGSSGSCVLDFDSKKVVGLHFGGWPMRQTPVTVQGGATIQAQLFYDNGAIPLWTLADDPLLGDILFGE